MPNDKEETVLRVVRRLVERAQQYREPLDNIAKQLEEYDSIEGRPPEMLMNSPLADGNAKVCKTGQYQAEMGPRLYKSNPAVSVRPEAWADATTQARAPVEEDYLTLCMERTGFARDIRRIIDDSFVARGVGWVELSGDDPRLSRLSWIPWTHFWSDPDAKKHEEITYIVRMRNKPRWEACALFSGKRDEILSSDLNAHDADNTASPIEYYEVWCRAGLQEYADGKNAKTPQTPMVYYVDKDFKILLDQRPWPTPFHRMKDAWPWPCVTLEYRYRRSDFLPKSPLELGLPWQCLLNKAQARFSTQLDFTTRRIFALLEGTGISFDQESLRRALKSGNAVELVQAQLNGAYESLPHIRVEDILKEIAVSAEKINEAIIGIDKIQQEWERTVGLYEFHFTGGTDRQDRSARATDARERNSMVRVEDMRDVLEEFLSESLRKMRFAARIHQTPEDISALMGSVAGRMWGYVVPDSAQTPERYFLELYLMLGQTPEIAIEESMESARQSVSLDQWTDASRCTIEVGSTVRMSPQQRQDLIIEANNQLTPALMNAGMPVAASYFIAQYAEAIGAPTKTIASIIADAESQQQMVLAQRELQMAQIRLQMQAMMNPMAPQPQQQPAAQTDPGKE